MKPGGANDPRLHGARRFEDGGWIYVHLEGDPGTIGFQHGYLLGPEIEDAFGAVSAEMMHETQRDWEFFRKAAREMLWPKIDAEYQQELQGIAEGRKSPYTPTTTGNGEVGRSDHLKWIGIGPSKI